MASSSPALQRLLAGERANGVEVGPSCRAVLAAGQQLLAGRDQVVAQRSRLARRRRQVLAEVIVERPAEVPAPRSRSWPWSGSHRCSRGRGEQCLDLGERVSVRELHAADTERAVRPLQAAQLEQRADLVLGRALEDRRLGLEAQLLAAQPRCVSRICPTFMRDGTPSGLSMISTGVPSGRNGMSSSVRCARRCPCCRGGRPSCRRRRSCASRRCRPSPAAPRPAAARPAGRPCRSAPRSSP
jgi:hypothetical protein